MKSFVSVLLLVGAVVAEPPRYRDDRFRPQRQETAPYPAAGYKPDIEFNLPSRQELQPPSTSYGVPTDSYAAPVNSYGAPRPEGRTNEKSEGDDNENKEGNDAETVEAVDGEQSDNKGKLQEGPQEDEQVVRSQGAYYVLLPGSQLQRVQFRTENDLRNMAYTARLRYSDADRAPLYLYNALPAAATAAPAPAAASAYIQLF